MADTYTSKYIRKMISTVQKNTAVTDKMIKNLRKCNRKLKAIDKGINILVDKITKEEQSEQSL